MDIIRQEDIASADLLQNIGSAFGYEGVQVWPAGMVPVAVGGVILPKADVQLNLFEDGTH